MESGTVTKYRSALGTTYTSGLEIKQNFPFYLPCIKKIKGENEGLTRPEPGSLYPFFQQTALRFPRTEAPLVSCREITGQGGRRLGSQPSPAKPSKLPHERAALIGLQGSFRL